MNEKKRLRKLRRLERRLRWSHWLLKDGRVSAAVKYGIIQSISYASFYLFLGSVFGTMPQSFWYPIGFWLLMVGAGTAVTVAISSWLYPVWLDGYERQKLKIQELEMHVDYQVDAIDELKAAEQQ